MRLFLFTICTVVCLNGPAAAQPAGPANGNGTGAVVIDGPPPPELPEMISRDAAGRIIQQTLPDGREIGSAYDANDNLTGLTPPGQPTHEEPSYRTDKRAPQRALVDGAPRAAKLVPQVFINCL